MHQLPRELPHELPHQQLAYEQLAPEVAPLRRPELAPQLAPPPAEAPGQAPAPHRGGADPVPAQREDGLPLRRPELVLAPELGVGFLSTSIEWETMRRRSWGTFRLPPSVGTTAASAAAVVADTTSLIVSLRVVGLLRLF